MYSRVFAWLLDVEPLWPISFQGEPPFKSTEYWAQAEDVRRALSLLSPEEQTKALKFYRHTDAKLCLGSCLLKRRAISDFCKIPWADVTISEDANRKPCYVSNTPTGKRLEFNVSHHGSLVALVGCTGDNVKLGVDVVKMQWERDSRRVMEEGWLTWAKTYELVFSDHEIHDITSYKLPSCVTAEEDIRSKLRHFYVHWCLKEAYVKMTGEALMASWLRQLEFRDVKVPAVASQGEWGEVSNDVEIWFRGKKVEGLLLEIRAFRDDYMVGICASTKEVTLQPFDILDVHSDVYPKHEVCLNSR